MRPPRTCYRAATLQWRALFGMTDRRGVQSAEDLKVIHEIAEIDVIDGHEAAFEAGVAQAAPHFKVAQGCRSFALNRSVEHPQRYRLVVGWDSVEDHMVHFRESEGFQAWRALVGPHFAAPPRVEHVTAVLDGF